VRPSPGCRAEQVFVTTHAAVGALVARVAPTHRLLPLAVTGVLSHYACDTIPHWGAGPGVTLQDRRFLAVAVPDGFAMLGLLAVLARPPLSPSRVAMLVTAAAAVAPDLDKPIELFFHHAPFPRWLNEFHGRIQTESPGFLRRDVLVATGLVLLARVARPGPATRR
jgi:hypothetical protein